MYLVTATCPQQVTYLCDLLRSHFRKWCFAKVVAGGLLAESTARQVVFYFAATLATFFSAMWPCSNCPCSTDGSMGVLYYPVGAVLSGVCGQG